MKHEFQFKRPDKPTKFEQKEDELRRSGVPVTNETIAELKRNTKPDESLAVNFYSPVDGRVISIGESSGVGNQIEIIPDKASQWRIRMYHVWINPDIHIFSKLKTGQKIGKSYRDIGWGDIAIQYNYIGGARLVSYFQVMPDSIFAKYQARGVKNRNDLIISKAYRDAHPLQCLNNRPNTPDYAQDYSDTPASYAENVVLLSGYEEKPEKIKTETNTFPKTDVILITANPFDLSQVAYFSKFRSCFGHELPGKNFQGQIETGSSIRHYVGFLNSLNNTNDKIKLFAPFDGFFFDIVLPRTTSKGDEYANFTVVSPLDPNVGFKISGANMLPEFKKGDKVKAGQLLGYAVVHNSAIDVDYQGVDNQQGNKRAMVWIFDSMFNHMTPEVLAEYEKYGLTKEKVIIDKEWRDKNPCNFFDAQRFLPNKSDADKVYTPQGFVESH